MLPDPCIRSIVNDYVEQVETALPGLLAGFYIYGSIALGDYSLSLSDIDFVAVIRSELNSGQLVLLAEVHRTVASKSRKPNMNGIYVTPQQLGKLPHEIAPYPYYCDNRLYASGYFECNLVTWAELKESGIGIIGPDPSLLEYEVDWNELLLRMRDNLNSYWHSWIQQSSRLWTAKGLALLGREAAEWGVLGISRLHYTFRENRITTKAGAGEYALLHVDPRWHSIIQEAIHYRRGKPSIYHSIGRRRSDALAYMLYMIEECNGLAASSG
ncbi:DUF4111 domain-containing protein [Paenibacillus oenotherae]|uniref:DUF4111 domain-containing protein n=2 Tax=Paenibacillus oenotherae TaxID=1435645 RepID=A0ABS7DBS0_9BACL|nr:DUF4111 domain-containing protein [Paenibacillus oenotherae]